MTVTVEYYLGRLSLKNLFEKNLETQGFGPPREAGYTKPEPSEGERITVLEKQVQELLALKDRVESLQGQLTTLRGRVQPLLRRGSIVRG